jgi:hypothetical protein
MKRYTEPAPADLIRRDFRELDGRTRLRTTWEVEQMLLIQSVEGHAHEGHGAFNGRRYPNTTLDHVTRALRLDPSVVKAERQAHIDAVIDYIDRALAGEGSPSPVDDQGEPLFGISTFRLLPADPRDVLCGLYLGGLRDDPDVRFEMERRRGAKIGGGSAYFVDYSRMRDMDLSGDELATGEWENEILRFKNEGLIVGEDRKDDPGVIYQYIRHRRGSGASDDTSIIAGGILWGFGVGVGLFLADAIDTFEKYSSVQSNQDLEITRKIEREMKDLDLTVEDAITLCYLQWIPEDAGLDVPDSSLRHMLDIDREHDLCPIESHFLTIQGRPAPPLRFSHGRTSARKFYAYVHRRIAEVK